MATAAKEYTLDAAAVDAVAAEIEARLAARKIERKLALRIRLTMEETLNRLLNMSDNPVQLRMTIGSLFGQIIVRIRYRGPACNPTADNTDDKDDSEVYQDFLSRLGLTPKWSYRGKLNTLTLRIPWASGNSQLLWLMVAIAAAAVAGMLGNLMTDNTRALISSALLAPLGKGFQGLMSTFAGLMVFLTVAGSIYNAGDISTLGRIGKVLFSRILILCTFCSLIPLYVFVTLTEQIWAGALRQLLSLWKPVLVFVIANLLYAALAMLFIRIRTRCPLPVLLRKVFPAAFLSFTTASGMASYTVGTDCCKKRLGIQSSLVDFCYPIGIVMYMPSVALFYVLVPVYLADMYHVEAQLPWFILCTLLATFLSIAVPPLPGNGIPASALFSCSSPFRERACCLPWH